MEYNKYAHYVTSCKYHIIFCPKYRRKVLTNGIDTYLKEVILSLQSDKYQVVEMEVMPDHVHLLLDCSPFYSPVDIVKHIKKQSAMRLKKQFPELKHRLPCIWTRSAFISSVGSVSMETVKQYIQEQKGK